MMKLEISEYGVYYIYDYIQEYNWDKYDFEKTEISQRILRYKDGKELAMNFFTDKLTEAVIEFSNNVLGSEIDEIALVAVPPSKVGKYSPISESIDTIVDSFNYRQLNKKFKHIKTIHNFSNLLKRVKDVYPSHKKGKRAIYAEHITSIECNDALVENSHNIAMIILDDITTTGMIMTVCEDILIDYDVEEDNIYKLAIANTIR